MFLISLPLEGAPSLIYPIEFYAALLWLAVLSAVAFSIWFYLLKTPGVKVSELNIWKFIMPVGGAILSWTILPNESPDVISVIGMSVIAISIIVYNKMTAVKED